MKDMKLNKAPILRLSVIFICVAIFSGCTTFPDLDDAVSARAKRADYPSLQPIDALFARFDTNGSRDIEAETQSLTARVASLKARAAQLRRPVINSGDRRRMAAAVKRHTG